MEPKLATQLHLQIHHAPTSVRCLNDTVTTSPGTVTTTVLLGPQLVPQSITFVLLHKMVHPLILGTSDMANLPFNITFDGHPIFTGGLTNQIKSERPTLQPGQGIHFKGGTSQEQEAVKNLIVQYKDLFFEYTGRYGLFRIPPLTFQQKMTIQPLQHLIVSVLTNAKLFKTFWMNTLHAVSLSHPDLNMLPLPFWSLRELPWAQRGPAIHTVSWKITAT